MDKINIIAVNETGDVEHLDDVGVESYELLSIDSNGNIINEFGD